MASTLYSKLDSAFTLHPGTIWVIEIIALVSCGPLLLGGIRTCKTWVTKVFLFSCFTTFVCLCYFMVQGRESQLLEHLKEQYKAKNGRAANPAGEDDYVKAHYNTALWYGIPEEHLKEPRDILITMTQSMVILFTAHLFYEFLCVQILVIRASMAKLLRTVADVFEPLHPSHMSVTNAHSMPQITDF